MYKCTFHSGKIYTLQSTNEFNWIIFNEVFFEKKKKVHNALYDIKGNSIKS